MNICLITNDFPPLQGGIANYVMGLYEGFKTLGHNCSVLFFPMNANIAVENSDVFIDPVRGKWIFSRLFSVKKAIARQSVRILQSDLVVVSAWSPLGAAYKAFLGKEKPKSVLLCYGNDVYEPMRSDRHRKRMQATFEYFDGLAAISHYTAGLCNKVTNKKVRMIGGGLDRRFIQINKTASSTNQKTPLTFLSVGRLIERKGCGRVIRCLAEIRHLLPEWRYLIIGQGLYEPELKKVITKFNLSQNVQILTNVSFDELLHWYGVSDIFIMISHEIPDKGEVEGLGLVYMEAGAAKLPVIAGRTGGVSDVVIDNVNGLLVDPLSDKEISETILKLCHNSRLRSQLGENGRRFAEQEWLWEKVARKIVESVN